MLHIVKSLAALPTCLKQCEKQDQVLLIEEACFALLVGEDDQDSKILDFNFSILRSDLEARGLVEKYQLYQSHIVDYNGMLDLTAKHHPCLTW
ncbi:sulfurtransferase complex subunit TusB [Alginatibacterium sediminis]|uniref:Sulfurtransferase complex subunit TusB n=1 Tax=Alginatibacterium sediminis TaxID=2164068 RepID=A0A420EJL7_9ALTE|nr:sulfurtransferase complex subunit TusB [Alginatibacterium sediminis]RKF20854.1 sulfurtransferase complex subunit TusB [Alginatibacterium sediminis]